MKRIEVDREQDNMFYVFPGCDCLASAKCLICGQELGYVIAWVAKNGYVHATCLAEQDMEVAKEEAKASK